MIFEKLANWKWQQREVIEIKFYINRTYLNIYFGIREGTILNL